MMKLIRSTGLGVIALAVLCAASSTTASAQATPSSPTAALARPAAGQLTAKIRYTTGGIPHILAYNWADLGFGYGYAFAKDNICTMANDYVTVEAQRARSVSYTHLTLPTILLV